MITTENGTIDVSKLEIEDIIDIPILQEFLDNFGVGMNCAAVAVDRNGKEVTRPSHYRPFCQSYIHKSKLGDERCARCHHDMGRKAIEANKPYIGHCHSGLIDFAAPIIIEGEHIGTVLGGQILEKSPDKEKIRNVARELKLSEEGLLEAADKIDILNMKNIQAAADVLNVVVNTLAKSGYNRLETEKLSGQLADNFIQISDTVEVLAEAALNITTNQSGLSKEITEIREVTREISEVLKAISKVASKTQIIGLNSSIEAARLGNQGKVFSVVSKEIQNLSESTQSTTKHVSMLNEKIDQTIQLTIENSSQILEITQEQSAAMEELSATIQDSVFIAEKLKEIFVTK